MSLALISTPYMEVVEGELAGMSFPLTKQEITIGRGEENDIVIKDAMVSSRHACITIRKEAIIIDDLHSTNGTIVNGVNIQSHMLDEGDHILIGGTELVFHTGVPGAAASASMGPQGKKKALTMPVLIGIIIAGLAIVAGLVVTLFVLRGKEAAKDKTPPKVEILKPAPTSRVELGFTPGSVITIEIEVKASDETELNKVDLIVNGEKVTTMRAEEGPDFAYSYDVAEPGTYAVKAVAYDATGNEETSGIASVEVWQDLEKKSKMEAYVVQADSLIMEYRQYRQMFLQAYNAAQGMSPMDPGWYQVTQTFLQVKENREKLLMASNGFPVTLELQTAHIYLQEMLKNAIQADNYAIQWAANMGTDDMAKNMLNSYSSSCQASSISFKASYDQVRAAYLGLGPSTPAH